MKQFSYRERDDAFGQSMLALRSAIGLTQAGLAEHLGVSQRAVGEWEAVSSYPKAHFLQHVITLAVQQQAFPLWVGHGQPTTIRQVAWSFEGIRLASEGWNGSVCLGKSSDSTLLAHLQRHRGMVMSVESRWDASGQCWRRERQRGTVSVGGTERGTHAHGGLGWHLDPPRSSYQGFSQAWGRQTSPPGTLVRLGS